MSSLFKQSVVVSGSRFLEKFLGFAVIIFLSRAMGSEGVGEFYYYFSLMSLFLPVMDLGFEKILMQRWHQYKHEEREKLFSRLVLLKVCVGFAALFCGVVVDAAVRWGDANPAAIFAAFLALYAEEFGELFRAPAHAENGYVYEVLVPLINKTLTIIGVWCFFQYIGSGWQIIYIYAAANALGTLVSIGGRGGLSPFKLQGVSVTELKGLIMSGIPFSVIGFCGLISLFVDSVMLGHYSFSEVGYYNAAYRVILVMAGLSRGTAYGIFPRIVKLNNSNRKGEVGAMINNALALFIIFFGALMLGGMATSSFLITMLYGAEFAPAILPFQILTLIMFLSPIADVLSHTVEALGRERRATRVQFYAAGFNVVANFIFIPIYGMIGAAITTVMTEIILLSFFYKEVRICHELCWNPRKLRNSFLFLISLAALYTPLFWIESWIAIPIGAVIAACLFLSLHRFWVPGFHLERFFARKS